MNWTCAVTLSLRSRCGDLLAAQLARGLEQVSLEFSAAIRMIPELITNSPDKLSEYEYRLYCAKLTYVMSCIFLCEDRPEAHALVVQNFRNMGCCLPDHPPSGGLIQFKVHKDAIKPPLSLIKFMSSSIFEIDRGDLYYGEACHLYDLWEGLSRHPMAREIVAKTLPEMDAASFGFFDGPR